MITFVSFETNLNENSYEPDQELPTHYKGWSIYTEIIRGKLWVHWCNPWNPALRYGCPMAEGRMDATIAHIQFQIDTAIGLESEGENKDKF